jgi:predicted nucleotidyltransferase
MWYTIIGEAVNTMTDKIYSIDEIKSAVEPIAQRYGAERVYLFGSYARGEATAKSDLDFLIDKGNIRGLQFCSMMLDLQDKFGKEVDMLSTDSLTKNDIFERIVQHEKRMIYEFN